AVTGSAPPLRCGHDAAGRAASARPGRTAAGRGVDRAPASGRRSAPSDRPPGPAVPASAPHPRAASATSVLRRCLPRRRKTPAPAAARRPGVGGLVAACSRPGPLVLIAENRGPARGGAAWRAAAAGKRLPVVRQTAGSLPLLSGSAARRGGAV